MYPVHLGGQRTTLREFQPDDLDDIHAIIGDDRVTAWLSFDSRSREAAAAMLAGTVDRARADPRQEYYLAVTKVCDDRLIGFGRLALGGVQAAKIGYAIHADHWGHGYATDAVRALVGYGFDHLDLHRITAAIGPDNAASIAVVERLRFVLEGTLRDHVFTNGSWRDSLLYSVLADEWPAPTA